MAREGYHQEVRLEIPALTGEGLGGNRARDLNVDLNAQVQISELVKNSYGKNPERYAGLTENKLNALLSNVFEQLNPDLRFEQKLELISKLLTQTVPSSLPMTAENCFGGRDPNGELLITQAFKGKTVIEHLNEMAVSPLCHELTEQGFSTSQFLTSTIQDMLDAGNTQQSENTATCAATCVQSYQITEDPEVFASRMTELVTQGKAFNPDGSTALRLPFVIPTDDRTLANSLYQSVLMNEGALMKAGSTGYNPLTDMVDGNVGMHKGIFSTQLKHLLQQATGKPHLIAYAGEDFDSIVRQNLDQRMNLVAVVEGIGSGDHLYHDVRVVGMEDGKVYFINPWPEEYLESKNGIKVINAETGLCSMPAHTLTGKGFLDQTQYLAYETDNPSDFNKIPSGIDEKNYNPKPAQFFTIQIDIQYLTAFLSYLERMKNERETYQKPKKKENRGKSDSQ